MVSSGTALRDFHLVMYLKEKYFTQKWPEVAKAEGPTSQGDVVSLTGVHLAEESLDEESDDELDSIPSPPGRPSRPTLRNGRRPKLFRAGDDSFPVARSMWAEQWCFDSSAEESKRETPESRVDLHSTRSAPRGTSSLEARIVLHRFGRIVHGQGCGAKPDTRYEWRTLT